MTMMMTVMAMAAIVLSGNNISPPFPHHMPVNSHWCKIYGQPAWQDKLDTMQCFEAEIMKYVNFKHHLPVNSRRCKTYGQPGWQGRCIVFNAMERKITKTIFNFLQSTVTRAKFMINMVDNDVNLMVDLNVDVSRCSTRSVTMKWYKAEAGVWNRACAWAKEKCGNCYKWRSL